MKLLVTGASSLIGRHTVAALQGAGHQVTAFQRSPSGLVATELLGALGSPEMAAACRGQDAVVHLAAKVGVVGTWDEFYDTNVGGTEALLAAAQDAGVQRFVHVSSPSVAHTGTALVGASATPAAPEAVSGHYSRSKAIAEQIALQSSAQDMAVVAIRPHLVWGPGDTQLIGRIVDRARRGRLALVGSGSALMDTTYVTNAADALVAAVDHCPNLGGQAFVVSNGEPRTVQELFQRITDAAGITWRPRRVPGTLASAGGTAAEKVWARTGRTDDPPITSFLAEQLATAHWFEQQSTQQALRWKPLVSLAQGFQQLQLWFANQR